MLSNAAKSIKSISELPSFRLIPDIVPENWADKFVVLYAEKEEKAIILVTGDEFGRPQMFEIKKRFESFARKWNETSEKKIKKYEICTATKEVINIAYTEQGVENNIENNVVGNSQKEYSRIESFIEDMISEAVRLRTSDIHIESREGKANIFFRINGQRTLWREVSSETARSVGLVLYVHADAGSKDVSWNTETVMDCATEWNLKTGQTVQLRFSSAPIYPSGGFHIVLRILILEYRSVDMKQLGYSPEQIKMLDVMITGASGVVLLCGPTNSGKSTTLQGLMQRIYERRGDTIKMISVEDPVEYVIPGACQIPVGRKKRMVVDERTGSAFTTFLRGTLRQDPDVVMVGEIRDCDSATVIKDLVLAGRKILATLHTYSALWAYVRLREIGVPWEILTMPGFIAGVVYQRLVPTLCQHCSIPITEAVDRVPHDVLHRVQQVSDLAYDNVRVRGDGCQHCMGTGISGRTVCAEFVLPDRMLLSKLAANDLIGAEKYWRDSLVGGREFGGVTALAHALHKMKKGILSPLDIEDQIAILTMDIVNTDNIISSSELSMLAGH